MILFAIPHVNADMRFLLLVLTGWLVPASLLRAQPAEPVLENALMWEIRQTDGPSSWLFGTIHLLPEADYRMPDTLLTVLAGSDMLVLELDMKAALDPAVQMALLPRMMMPEGVTLKTLLKEEDHALVMEAIAASGWPTFLAEGLKPLFLSALIEPGLGLGTGLASFDMALYEYAGQKGIRHTGLESMEEQLAAFDAIPLEEQARLLVAQLRDDKGGTSAFDGLVKAYLTEDLSLLQQAMEEQESGQAAFMEALLYQRNDRWIERMVALMKEGRIFFAVGAGHLGGERGVIRQLQRAGYSLVPHPVFR